MKTLSASRFSREALKKRIRNIKSNSETSAMPTTEPITEEDLLVYGAYARVIYSLRHSNRVQQNFKIMTLTWFVATFIGIGYLISSREINLPFHPLLIVPIVCLASLSILGIIWYLDLIVEEKKIASIVNRGIKKEKNHPILPKPFHNVETLQSFLGYISLKTLFYLGLSSILVLTMAFSISAYLYLGERWISFSIVLLSPLAIIPSLFGLSIYIVKKKDPYLLLIEIDMNEGLKKE